MTFKLLKAASISAALLFSSLSLAAECRYYAFVDHGVNGEQARVFRSSGVRMYQPGLVTAYGTRGEINKDGFTMEQLGPFPNAGVAKVELNKKLESLSQQGYLKKTGNNGMPRIYLLNKKLCQG